METEMPLTEKETIKARAPLTGKRIDLLPKEKAYLTEPENSFTEIEMESENYQLNQNDFIVERKMQEIPEQEINLSQEIPKQKTEFENYEKAKTDFIAGETILIESLPSGIEFYQTPGAIETIAIIKDFDGSISIGFARAGRLDIENRKVTPKAGMEIAKGRAIKAMELKCSLIEKNYLRGIYASRIENENI